MNEQTCQTPAWELVLKKCWVPDCPKLATVGDWSGWWWCDDHQDRLMGGTVTNRVTWVSAAGAIRDRMIAEGACGHPCPNCLLAHYEAGLRPFSWIRAHLLDWPAVLPPHEAQVRPAGASAFGADVEGVA